MSVIEKLKAKSMELRKARHSLAPSIVFALSEIEKVGKNAGNRATTEDEAIKVIQKLVVTIDGNIKLCTESNHKAAMAWEKDVLQSVLPQMATETEIVAFLNKTFSEAPANKGIPFKALKAEFGALVDMRVAGDIVTTLYGL